MKKKELEEELEKLRVSHSTLAEAYENNLKAASGMVRAIENGTRFGLAQKQSIEDLLGYVFDLEENARDLGRIYGEALVESIRKHEAALKNPISFALKTITKKLLTFLKTFWYY